MTKINTNDPSSAVQFASLSERHSLGWSLRLVFRALKVTDLRWQRDPKRRCLRKPQIFADTPRLECTKIARFSAVAAAIFTAPGEIARLFEAPRCAISFAKKIASEPRFFLRWKRVKLILAAEFPAIPSSAMKIASERRCAILVHSAPRVLEIQAFGGRRKRRRPKIFAENRRKPQIGLCHLRSVNFSSSLCNLPWLGRCLSPSEIQSGCRVSDLYQRKTKGQQLKGKIVSEIFTLFHTFSHFLALFHNFSPGTFPFKTKGFSSIRTKEKKK